MIAIADILFFVSTLIVILVVGLYAGREEKTKEDYFLGGRSLPWWGVCGSLFGTNISANHIVGMLGIGFSVGFAQSHYEFGSIPAVLLLAFVFLPILRKRKFYTLSQFLGERYGNASSYLYSIILLILILIQLTGALYIGARAFLPFARQLFTQTTYTELVLLISFTATVYTWFGGLKSVVYTDVIQTALILISGLVLAYLALSRPEVGGLSGLFSKELNQPRELSHMNLYLPASHEILPWTGVLSGMFILHIFYWNTNQYVVQRALGAKSLNEARNGILASGFLKLTVPFFSILTGVAAYYIWQSNGMAARIDPDEAFSKLVLLIVPNGWGLIGLILAGLLGAIFSSIDSMLHSASTLFTIDIYLPLLRKMAVLDTIITKETEDRLSIKMGRLFLLGFSVLTTILALLVFDPNSKGNFFIQLSAQSSNFTPGILAVFVMGIFWEKSHKTSAWIVILLTPVLSYLLPPIYENLISSDYIKISFGEKLNFLHRVFLVTICSFLLHYILSSLFVRKDKVNQNPLSESAISKERFEIGFPSWFTSSRIIVFGIYFGLLVCIVYMKIVSAWSGWILFLLPCLATFVFTLWVCFDKKASTDSGRKRLLAYRKDVILSGLLMGLTLGFYFLF